jgi:hypothetical protein
VQPFHEPLWGFLIGYHMAGFPDDVKKVFTDWKQDKLLTNLEGCVNEALKRRVDYVEYGDPDKLTPKKRAALNSKLLAQALLHRADCLLQAAGRMLLAKNVYGLALIARGHVEATAVLGHFCKRINSLSKGNIDFDRYELGQRFLGLNHIRQPRRVCKTKCG